MDEFNILAVISAGTIKEDDNNLLTMQNISRENAHIFGRWLALITDAPIELRLIGFAGVDEIHYTPKQVREDMEQANRSAT